MVGGIMSFLIAGVISTVLVLAFLWVFGKLPVLAQVKQAALQ